MENSYYDDNEDYDCSSSDDTEQTCYGCKGGRLGQRDHMACPDGCLHEKTECKICLSFDLYGKTLGKDIEYKDS